MQSYLYLLNLILSEKKTTFQFQFRLSKEKLSVIGSIEEKLSWIEPVDSRMNAIEIHIWASKVHHIFSIVLTFVKILHVELFRYISHRMFHF